MAGCVRRKRVNDVTATLPPPANGDPSAVLISSSFVSAAGSVGIRARYVALSSECLVLNVYVIGPAIVLELDARFSTSHGRHRPSLWSTVATTATATTDGLERPVVIAFAQGIGLPDVLRTCKDATARKRDT